MPSRKTSVAPLPQSWLEVVIPLLEEGDPDKIAWTRRAQEEMSSCGLAFKPDAYDLCLRVLRATGMLGERITGMVDHSGGSECETWAFLCPHPLGIPKPLYVKIGVPPPGSQLLMISMHTDDSGKLLQAIRDYRNEQQKNQP